jgi:hypothetical protein
MTGCFTTTYHNNLQPDGDTHTETARFFVFGFVGTKEVDMRQICPQGVAYWYDEQTISDTACACLTAGLYTPRTITVRCTGGHAYQLIPHSDSHMTEVVPLPESESESQPGRAGGAS